MLKNGVRVLTDWSLRGLDTVIIENGLLRVVLLPALGGKVWQLTRLPAGFDLLWRHPRIAPHTVPFGSTYDDVFFGGWDELFPNDLAEEINGEPMPDHGEVWSLPWQWSLEAATADRVTVHLWVETPISACRLDKWISVSAAESRVRFRHRITNNGAEDLPYLWKLHVAVALADDSRIELGCRRMLIGPWGRPRGGVTDRWYDWPRYTDPAGAVHDMSRTLPTTARVSELQFGTDLDRGWCAVSHPRDGVGLGLEFDPNVFPSCWTFASYGGWRNLRVLVLEPCTGYPLSVVDGVADGTHRVLGAGAALDSVVTAVVFDAVEAGGAPDGE